MNLSIEANRVDPDQTAQSDLGPHCLSKRLLKHFRRREKQANFVAIGALRVECDFLYMHYKNLGLGHLLYGMVYKRHYLGTFN